jgi:hypothetical protein
MNSRGPYAQFAQKKNDPPAWPTRSALSAVRGTRLACRVAIVSEETLRRVVHRECTADACQASRAATGQGHTLAHFRAQLQDLRDTSLTLELNLSTFGTHSRAWVPWRTK